MSTGLAVFDASLQDTNLWLKAIEADLGDCERQEAYSGLRAVLHALRDTLPSHAAVNFAAQLPMLMRGLYYEGWTLPEKPHRIREFKDFAHLVEKELTLGFRFSPVTVMRAVFAAIGNFTGEGEREKLRVQLPAALVEFWLESTQK